VLRLSGDAHPFDNTLYFTDERREEATVVYVGDDAEDDPAGLLYYLHRVFADTPRRSVRVASVRPKATLPWEPGRPPALVVVSAETPPETARRLRDYLRDGGTLLDVVLAPGRS